MSSMVEEHEELIDSKRLSEFDDAKFGGFVKHLRFP